MPKYTISLWLFSGGFRVRKLGLRGGYVGRQTWLQIEVYSHERFQFHRGL